MVKSSEMTFKIKRVERIPVSLAVTAHGVPQEDVEHLFKGYTELIAVHF